MSKTLLLWLVVAVIVVAAAIVITNKNNEDAMQAEGGVQSVIEDAEHPRSLAEIARAGEDAICTFSSEDPNSKSSGTVYVSDNKVRGDFSSTLKTNGMSVMSHMLQKDGMVYTWTNLNSMGMKFQAATTDGSEGPAAGTMSFDYGAKLDYDCTTWNADTATFELPAGIEFK